MSFREFAKRARAAAAHMGIRAPMNQLNHAIAGACYDKKYPAVIAAEKAGTLPPFKVPPPYITKAALEHNIDPHSLGCSLRDALEPHPQAAEDRYGNVMKWINQEWLDQVGHAFHDAVAQFAAPDLVSRMYAQPIVSDIIKHAFTDHLIADTEFLDEEGFSFRVCRRLLEDGVDNPPLNAYQREYIKQLSQTPLKLYRVVSVDPGFAMQLHPIGGSVEERVWVNDPRSSEPADPRYVLACRVLSINGQMEMAGGIIPLHAADAIECAIEQLKSAKGRYEIWRVIMMSFLWQMDLASENQREPGLESTRVVTDTYYSVDLHGVRSLLDEYLDLVWNDDEDEETWTLYRPCEHGEEFPVCEIGISDDDEEGFVRVAYADAEIAAEAQPWFEQQFGESLQFAYRTVFDPETGEEREVERTQANSPSVITELLAAAILSHYLAWADIPQLILGGRSPRHAAQSALGKVLVTSMIAEMEEEEIASASNENRVAMSFEFLYAALKLVTAESNSSDALDPTEFLPTEAWLIFNVLDTPANVERVGQVMPISIMDVASTNIIETIHANPAKGIDSAHACSLLDSPKFMGGVNVPLPRPRIIFITEGVKADALVNTAAKRDIEVAWVSEAAARPIISEFQQQIRTALNERSRPA